MHKLLITICLALQLGCSGALPAIKPPRLDSAAAAENALTEFDADSNGSVSKSEACMGISQAFDRYDSDGNGEVSAEEFKSRFELWSGGDTGMMNLQVRVSHRGQPLIGATIEMTPYSFLGDGFLASEGETDSYGYAFMAIPKDKLPKTQQHFGMQVGLYKVSISHPQRKLPAKYNEETALSVDLSPNEANTGVQFELK